METYFDGYCPESLLQGRQVEMRLNKDDFWESEATGLQVTVFPPYATLLRWRGSGRFRTSTQRASDVLTGLVMAAASEEEGREIFPDENRLINNNTELEEYLATICKDRDAYNATTFNRNNPALKAQESYLASIPRQSWQRLLALASSTCPTGDNDTNVTGSINDLHRLVYEMKLLVDFDWMNWEQGRQNLGRQDVDFSGCSPLEVSMYLTTIFRADRFMEGTLAHHHRNGNLFKLISALQR